jgi:hypothetical protein
MNSTVTWISRSATGTQKTDRALILVLLRRLPLLAALWAACTLWTSPAFAEILPTFLSCDDDPQGSKPPPFCVGNWITAHDPDGTPPFDTLRFSSLIGYIDQTPVQGTVAVTLTCNEVQRVPRAPTSCDGRWYVTNGSNSKFDSFIGYVYTTQVPGTLPVYIACELEPRVPKKPPTCTSQWYTTQNANDPFASFVGYIYVDPPIERFGFSPKYYIGSVIYVPPGQGPSSITYGSGTVIGTTLSTTNSWNFSIGFTFGGFDIGKSAGTDEIDYGNAFGGATTNSTDVQQTISSSVRYEGPRTNIINHDYDQIVLFFGVKINAEVDYLGAIRWGIDFSQVAAQGFSTTGYPIPVGCLRQNSTIPQDYCDPIHSLLASQGIMSDEYPTILGAHPFADPNASQQPDPSRYVLVDAVNFLPNPTSSTVTYLLNNNSTTTNSVTSSFTYTVGLKFSIPTFALKVNNQFTFTQSSTTTNRTGSTGTSTFTLSLPSIPYNGPTTVLVYVDTIYKTFMFAFPP